MYQNRETYGDTDKDDRLPDPGFVPERWYSYGRVRAHFDSRKVLGDTPILQASRE
jgi:hypothetical protein